MDSIGRRGIGWSACSATATGGEREAPLLERPWLSKDKILAQASAEGIEPPRLYGFGSTHNNCGMACVKAGQAAWKRLLLALPERYLWWEQQEERIRRYLDKNVTILKDRRGGQKKPFSLREFRERLQETGEYDADDWGSCGCYQVTESDEDEALVAVEVQANDVPVA